MSAKNRPAALILAALLGGCAVGPDFAPPPPPDLAHYGVDDPTGHVAYGAEVAADWWRLFGSATLNDAVQAAMAGNPGLEAARHNLRQSQHLLQSGYGIVFPTLGLDGGAERQQFNGLRFDQATPPGIFNLFTLGATVTYALDIWGGERRQIEALGASRDLADAEARATALALAANVVNGMIARAAYQGQIERSERAIALTREQALLAESQYQAGLLPWSAVLALRGQLAGLNAALPPLRQRLVQTEDLLATLAGSPPAAWRGPQLGLDELTLPDPLPVSLPAELVRRRPDLRAAEAAVHAASANVGVATAAMLPALSLSGSIGGQSTAINKLFDAGGNVWDFGVAASAPLFEGGTLWYRRQAAIDLHRQTLALYRQTLLAAFAQVADSLRALAHDAAALQADEEAASSAAQTLSLLQANYRAGLAAWQAVLAADQQLQQAEITVIQARALRLQDSVALLAAIGGPWPSED